MAGLAGLFAVTDSGSLDAAYALIPGSGCTIKGNVSINTGERIYHVPRQNTTTTRSSGRNTANDGSAAKLRRAERVGGNPSSS